MDTKYYTLTTLSAATGVSRYKILSTYQTELVTNGFAQKIEGSNKYIFFETAVDFINSKQKGKKNTREKRK